MAGLFALVLSSCDDDEKSGAPPAKPTITVEAVGIENNKVAFAGADLHTEGEIMAEGLVKSFTITVTDRTGKEIAKKEFSDPGNAADKMYVGIKDPHFHEHVDIPASAPEGAGKVTFIVVDMKGQTATVTDDIEIKQKIADIGRLSIGTDDSGTGTVGEAMPVKAHVKMLNGTTIKEIEVEFHNEEADAEFPVSYKEKYEGKSEVDFSEDYELPDNAPAGDYHVHFTVTDANGNEESISREGVTITAKR